MYPEEPPEQIVRILVVDGDPGVADLFRNALEDKMSVEIVRAGDADSARSKISDSDFDVVTVDYGLPDETGLVLLEDIVEGEDNPPVIVITEHGDVHLATRSFELGAAGYVIKDYELPRTLSSAVEKALDKAALKRAADALNRGNAFAGVGVNALDEVFFVLDTKGRFISWNKRLQQVTGFTGKELHLMDSARMFTAEDSKRFLDAVASLGTADKAVIRLHIGARDGARVPYELNAVTLKDDEGGVIGTCAIGREVGWSRKVRRSRGGADVFDERTGVAELTGDVIARVDYDGRFTYLSDAACAFWGKPREELLGRDYTELVHPDDLENSIVTGMRALKTNGVIKGLLDRQNTPHGWRYVEWNSAPVFDGDGSCTGFQFTGRDVTERVLADRLLVQVNRELDAYAHTVSHDLKGPLSAITLAADTLRLLVESREGRDMPDSSGDVQEMAQIISRYTQHAGALVENLLALAESGQVPVEVEDVDVSEVIEGILDRMESLLHKRNVTVKLSDELGRVRGNRMQVTQVFSNLIHNAVEHNDKPSPVVEVTYLGMEEGCHRYVVRDNGPGVPEQHLDDVFKLFHKGQSGGAGIGLATVDKIIDVYDGFIRVYNDGGACFEFSLKDINQ